MSGMFDIGDRLQMVRDTKPDLLCNLRSTFAALVLCQERSFKEWSARPENARLAQDAQKEELQATLRKQEEAACRKFRDQV
jgi:hypothetical protein